ncbi:MAG: aldo/keto reductase [Gammaproteobacteria bacterium]
MEYFEFDGAGRMPALGLGTWKSEPGTVGDVIHEALRIGYRHIDCAPIYQNEHEIGDAFDTAFKNGDVAREDLWVTSKLWNSNHARQDVVPAIEKTLTDLKLDYLDLFLIHWPIAFRHGVAFPEGPADFVSLDQTPLAETWQGMEDAVEKGLCRAIGVSNFSSRKIGDLLACATIKPIVNQVEAHPFFPQRELLSWCADHDIALTAYSPLGSGDRIPEFKQDDEPEPLKHSVILDIARRRDLSAGQVLLAWAIQRGTSVIPKSSNPKRLRQNFEAANVVLEDDDMRAIGQMESGYRIIHGAFFADEASGYTVAKLWDETDQEKAQVLD